MLSRHLVLNLEQDTTLLPPLPMYTAHTLGSRALCPLDRADNSSHTLFHQSRLIFLHLHTPRRLCVAVNIVQVHTHNTHDSLIDSFIFIVTSICSVF